MNLKNLKIILIILGIAVLIEVGFFYFQKNKPSVEQQPVEQQSDEKVISPKTQTFNSNEEPQELNLFIAGTNGYHTYRIPSLIVTSKGTLLAFAEGRKASEFDSGDIDIVLKRSFDNGETWTDMQIVYEEGGNAAITIGNPCSVVDRSTGTVWLLFTRNNERVFAIKSTDEGVTWLEPIEITKTTKAAKWELYGTGPGVGIQLTDGTMIIPCWHTVVINSHAIYSSHIIYSDDHGATWELGGGTGDQGNECQVVELVNKTLLLAIRDYTPAHRQKIARSWDNGFTWSYPKDHPDFSGTSCQLSIIRFTDETYNNKNRLLFSNPASTSAREKMTVRLSYDEGETWPISKLLHPGPSAYSSLAVLPNGKIACLYEGGEEHMYKNIIFSRFSLEWLTDGKDSIAK